MLTGMQCVPRCACNRWVQPQSKILLTAAQHCCTWPRALCSNVRIHARATNMSPAASALGPSHTANHTRIATHTHQQHKVHSLCERLLRADAHAHVISHRHGLAIVGQAVARLAVGLCGRALAVVCHGLVCSLPLAGCSRVGLPVVCMSRGKSRPC